MNNEDLSLNFVISSLLHSSLKTCKILWQIQVLEIMPEKCQLIYIYKKFYIYTIIWMSTGWKFFFILSIKDVHTSFPNIDHSNSYLSIYPSKKKINRKLKLNTSSNRCPFKDNFSNAF